MVPGSTSPLLPVMPMAVRCAPGMECARYPIFSIFWQTSRTCSSVACAFITTSIGSPRELLLWRRPTGPSLEPRLQGAGEQVYRSFQCIAIGTAVETLLATSLAVTGSETWHLCAEIRKAWPGRPRERRFHCPCRLRALRRPVRNLCGRTSTPNPGSRDCQRMWVASSRTRSYPHRR